MLFITMGIAAIIFYLSMFGLYILFLLIPHVPEKIESITVQVFLIIILFCITYIVLASLSYITYWMQLLI